MPPNTELNPVIELCAHPLLNGVIGSLIAAAIVAGLGYLWLSKSLYKRMNELAEPEKYAQDALSALKGAKSFLDKAQQNVGAQFMSSGGSPQTAAQWLNSELSNIRNSIGDAEAHLHRFSGGIRLLEKAGDEIK